MPILRGANSFQGGLKEHLRGINAPLNVPKETLHIQAAEGDAEEMVDDRLLFFPRDPATMLEDSFLLVLSFRGGEGEGELVRDSVSLG